MLSQSQMTDMYFQFTLLIPIACWCVWQVFDGLLTHSVKETGNTNNLQLIFLVIEGCVACGLAAGYIIYMLRKVSLQRYTLYETFLAIPIGLTRALATQNTSLLEDEESEDGSEEGEVIPKVRVCNLSFPVGLLI